MNTAVAMPKGMENDGRADGDDQRSVQQRQQAELDRRSGTSAGPRSDAGETLNEGRQARLQQEYENRRDEQHGRIPAQADQELDDGFDTAYGVWPSVRPSVNQDIGTKPDFGYNLLPLGLEDPIEVFL